MMTSLERSDPKSGFSLLEALISLLVIAVSFAAIYTALSDTARQSHARQMQYEAAELAVSLLTEAAYRQAAITSLDALRYEPQWRWELTRQSSDQSGRIGGGPAAFRLIEATVWSGAGRELITLRQLQNGAAQ